MITSPLTTSISKDDTALATTHTTASLLNSGDEGDGSKGKGHDDVGGDVNKPHDGGDVNNASDCRGCDVINDDDRTLLVEDPLGGHVVLTRQPSPAVSVPHGPTTATAKPPDADVEAAACDSPTAPLLQRVENSSTKRSKPQKTSNNSVTTVCVHHGNTNSNMKKSSNARNIEDSNNKAPLACEENGVEEEDEEDREIKMFVFASSNA
jgi:hypothetical protein